MKSSLEFSFLYLLSAASTAAAAENASTAAASAIHWSPPPTATNATAVNQGYIGFGIEMKSFPDYAGLNTTNDFTAYLLTLLSTRTGGAPIPIRIGGTSMDNTRFDPASTANATTPTGEGCKLHTNVTTGAPWLRGLANLPAAVNPRYTLQIPLARKDVANGVAFAGAGVEAMGEARLDALEIGNEPNFYPKFGCGNRTDRDEDWGPVDYAREWRRYAGNLTRGVEGLGGGEWFQALGLSSSVDEVKWDFSKFWDQMTEGGHVKTVSQHYYQGNASGNLTYELMTHAVTVQKMEDKFRHNLNFSHNHSTPFVLGEVGSAIGGNGTPNMNLYGTLGAALWTLDFLLYGMTMGIRRVSMQLGTGFKIAAWQPINGKAVHGNFYGLAAGADFIGSAGDLKIQALDLTGHPNVVGYAGYNGGELSKVAVLNLNFWNEDGPRGKRDVNLTGLPDEVKRVRVSRLTGANATAEEGITWAGKRWTAENDGKEYQDGAKPVTIDVQNNSPVGNVTVYASEAVLVEMLKN